MVNKRRGEIEARLGGRVRRLCLTLGVLADLESACKVDNIATLINRLDPENLSAGDILQLLLAGLRGAGSEEEDLDPHTLGLDENVGELLAVAYRLLEATFGGEKNQLDASSHGVQADEAPPVPS